MFHSTSNPGCNECGQLPQRGRPSTGIKLGMLQIRSGRGKQLTAAMQPESPPWGSREHAALPELGLFAGQAGWSLQMCSGRVHCAGDREQDSCSHCGSAHIFFSAGLEISSATPTENNLPRVVRTNSGRHNTAGHGLKSSARSPPFDRSPTPGSISRVIKVAGSPRSSTERLPLSRSANDSRVLSPHGRFQDAWMRLHLSSSCEGQ